MYKKDKISSNKLQSVIIAVLVVVVLGLGALLLLRSNDPNNSEGSDTTTVTETQDVTLTPPTQEEISAGQATKDDTINQNNEAIQASEGQNEVTPVISTWNREGNKIIISGFVPGIVESDGDCTLTLSNGSQEVTLEHDARADAQTTVCGTFEYDDSLSGDITMQLYYSSPTSVGYSDELDLDV